VHICYFIITDPCLSASHNSQNNNNLLILIFLEIPNGIYAELIEE